MHFSGDRLSKNAGTHSISEEMLKGLKYIETIFGNALEDGYGVGQLQV